MVEKKQVLYDLRTTYSGPFLVEEFYAEVENWAKDKGYDKDPKKKMEHVTKDGKKIEWVVEIHHHLDDLHQSIVILRALFDNVKEIVIKKDGKKLRINNGDAYISIDGFIHSHIQGTFWQAKPMYYFFRGLVDHYIYNFWSFRHDGKVQADCHELFKKIRSFFSLQKYKYE